MIIILLLLLLLRRRRRRPLLLRLCLPPPPPPPSSSSSSFLLLLPLLQLNKTKTKQLHAINNTTRREEETLTIALGHAVSDVEGVAGGTVAARVARAVDSLCLMRRDVQVRAGGQQRAGVIHTGVKIRLAVVPWRARGGRSG